MKIHMSQDVFAEAVSWVSRFIPTRLAMPVLSGMIVKASDEGVVSLSSHGLEVSAHADIEADVEEPGEFLVNGRLLADISKALPNKKMVSLILDGSKISVECGLSKFSLPTMPMDDFPALPELPRCVGTVDADVWQEAVTQVTSAASTDDTLPILQSICIEINGEVITLNATDRYRLATREIKWTPEDPTLEARILVRASRLADIAKSLTTAGELQICFSDSEQTIGFSAGTRQNIVRLIGGEYPAVQGLFPQNPAGYAVVDRLELLDAIKRVGLVTDRNSSLKMSFTSEYVNINAGGMETAQAAEAVPLHFTSEEIEFSFNPLFIRESLAYINQPWVRISYTASPKPVVLCGQDEPDGPALDDFRVLLMPIRERR